jgi:hypothetical protein
VCCTTIGSIHEQVRGIVRVPLSLLTRLRLILFGHEDLAGIVFSASLQELFAKLPNRPMTRVYVTEGNKLLAWLDPREALTPARDAAAGGR